MTERLPSALEFLRDVAARVGSVFGDLRPEVSEGRLIIDRGDPTHPLTLGFGPDGRGHVKLYAAAVVNAADSRSAGSRLGRVLGTVQVIPEGDHNEVRRWSPYRLEDVERSRSEAEEWGAATLVSLLRELPAEAVPTGPAEPPSVGPGVTAPPEPQRAAPSWIGDARAGELQRMVADLQARLAAVIVDRDRLRAENAALRNSAVAGDEIARLGADLEAARGEAAESLALAESTVRDAEGLRQSLGEAAASLAQREAERDAALHRMRELEVASQNERSHGGALPAETIRHLLDSFSVISDGGARAGACAAVLRHYLDIVPGDPQLSELLGVQLLRDDQVREAIRVLSAIGTSALTPRGAAAMTEASFRSKELPDPVEVIGRVDWLVGGAAHQLRDVPRWLRGPDLLRLAELVAENAPPDPSAFLSEVARVATGEQLARVFTLWFDLDLSAALDQLVAWAEAGRVQASEQWVREGLTLALGADERRTVRTALELLARDSERSRDPVGMLDLVSVARDRLRPIDSRKFAVKWLREIASAVSENGDGAWVDRAADILRVALADVALLRDGAPELELALVLIPRASAEEAAMLRQAVDDRRPKVDIATRDVTTVTEALQAAAERFPDLVVLPEAEKSAARRGTGSVKKAREALLQLGEIAQRYTAGELDEGLDEALAALPDFKPDISDTSKRQYAKEYARVLRDGRRIMLGPHFDIGGEDGRAYLYVDREAKRIVLGHCGGHLRGKRDS